MQLRFVFAFALLSFVKEKKIKYKQNPHGVCLHPNIFQH